MRRYFQDLSNINFYLLIAIAISFLLPTIYSTVRIFFLGSLPDINTFTIAAQNVWVQLLYEIIYEGLLFPLFYLLGSSLYTSQQFNTRLTIAFLICCFTYFIFSFCIYFFIDNFIINMQQKEDLIGITKQYIQLEIIAIALISIYMFNTQILRLKQATKAIYYLIAAQFSLNVLFDILFVSNMDISFKLGILGIAYTNIAVNSILIIISILIIFKIRIKYSLKNWKNEYSWIIQSGKLFILSATESFIRNILFIFIILRMINNVESADIYWITNQFIWGWLLLLPLSLSELIKIDVATNQGFLPKRLFSYITITTVFLLIWIVSMPLWDLFLTRIINNPHISISSIMELISILLIFYMLFAYQLIFDGYFYGTGNITLILLKTCIVNFFYYGGAFILYKFNYWLPSLISITYLFGFGLLFSFVVTIGIWLIHKHKLLKYKDITND